MNKREVLREHIISADNPYMQIQIAINGKLDDEGIKGLSRIGFCNYRNFNYSKDSYEGSEDRSKFRLIGSFLNSALWNNVELSSGYMKILHNTEFVELSTKLHFFKRKYPIGYVDYKKNQVL